MSAAPGSHSTPISGHPAFQTLTDDPKIHGKLQPSYWDRLPVEILADIFLMCRPLKEDLPPSNTHAPYLLTCVCQVWYKIVTDIPKMWSTIVLTTASIVDPIPPSRLAAGTRHLGMCIDRSKATPLDLYIRAEFIAHPASFRYVECAELQSFVLVYPLPLFGPLPPFFPLPLQMVMPDLTTLEVHSQRAIASSDLVVLNGIMDSTKALKRHVSLRPGTTRLLRPPVIQNVSGLEVLTLQRLIPVSVCPLILQKAPFLRKLSLCVWVSSETNPIYKSALELWQISNTEEMTRPFVHSRLQYLALAHSKCDLSTFFEYFTLPILQFLVVDFRARASTSQASWPHDNFINFLRRSGCKLRSFHVLDQPITSSQLLELLRLPNLVDSLDYLGIQHYTGEEQAIDDYLLEQLTLPLPTLREEGPLIPPHLKVMDAGSEHSSVLCPNIERFLLFVPLEGFTLPKLVSMLSSRLPFNVNPARPYRPLRQIEIDLYDGMEADIRSLREKGLVLTLFEPSKSDPMPLDAEQQRLWGYHLFEGLDDEVYDHATGTWKTSDVTLALP